MLQLGIQAVLQTVVTGGLRTTTRIRKFHNAQSIHSGVNLMSCKNPPHPARLRSLQRREEGCCWHFLPANREKLISSVMKDPFFFFLKNQCHKQTVDLRRNLPVPGSKEFGEDCSTSHGSSASERSTRQWRCRWKEAMREVNTGKKCPYWTTGCEIYWRHLNVFNVGCKTH